MEYNISRQAELSRLYESVLSRENLLLKAASGMGKTRLCKDLVGKLEGRRICYYFSARGFVSLSTIVSQLMDVVSRGSQRYPNVDYNIKRFFSENPRHEFKDEEEVQNYFRALNICLEQMAKDFIFIIEDIDQWEGTEDLPALLEKLCQSKNNQLLLSSGNNLELSIEVGTHNINPLKTDHILELTPTQETAQELIEYTYGHTAFTLELLPQLKNQQSLTEAIESYMPQQHSSFYSFRSRFTDLQWRLLKALAFEETVEQPHSFNFLMKHKLGAASSIERALKNLSESNMIHKNSQGWKIKNVIFQRWLQWLYKNYT